MGKDKVNITLDRDLWDGLAKFAHHQSILMEKRVPTIQALRTAIRTFLKMEPKEINRVLLRKTRNL